MVAATVAATDQLLDGPQAIELVTGDRVNYGTYFRWTQAGLLAGDGSRIRLEFVKCGRKRKTTVESVRRFLAQLTEAAGGSGFKTQSERRLAAQH